MIFDIEVFFIYLMPLLKGEIEQHM